MAISAVTGSSTPITVSTLPTQQTVDSAVVRQVEQKPTVKDVDNIMSTEQYVKQYFADIPIMIQIARCESTFHQLDPDGEVHRGRVDNEDVGVMQINEHYNGAQAERENYDIYTLPGNVAFARELYEAKGTAPWRSSKACWGKYQNESGSDIAMNSK